MVNCQTAVIRLSDQFEGTIDIAQGAGGIRPATGNDIDLAAIRAQAFGRKLHFGLHILASPMSGRGRAVKVIQKHVAIVIVIGVV